MHPQKAVDDIKLKAVTTVTQQTFSSDKIKKFNVWAKKSLLKFTTTAGSLEAKCQVHRNVGLVIAADIKVVLAKSMFSLQIKQTAFYATLGEACQEV